MSMDRRNIELVVISDVHLGTYGCHAMELVKYLKSISPKILILNGDIIDMWQFRKSYFPITHMQVIKEIMNLLSKGVKVIYITGNHDESLRRYSGIKLANFELCDKYMIDLDGKKTWIFHGDVFDATTKGSAKILAKLGGHGYDLLIVLNRLINSVLTFFGKEKMSFSKKVKNGVKKAVSWIGNFEQTAAELAIENKYDFVICGHIHQPQKRIIKNEQGSIVYLNSGDWVENLTALEYNNKNWEIFHYNEKDFSKNIEIEKKLPTLDVQSSTFFSFISKR